MTFIFLTISTVVLITVSSLGQIFTKAELAARKALWELCDWKRDSKRFHCVKKSHCWSAGNSIQESPQHLTSHSYFVTFTAGALSSTVGHWAAPQGQSCVKHTAERLLKGSCWGVGKCNIHTFFASLSPASLGIGTADLPCANLSFLPLDFHQPFRFPSHPMSLSVFLDSGPGLVPHSKIEKSPFWSFLFLTPHLGRHSIN